MYTFAIIIVFTFDDIFVGRLTIITQIIFSTILTSLRDQTVVVTAFDYNIILLHLQSSGDYHQVMP